MKKICVIFLFLSGCASHTYYYPNIPKDYAVSEITEKEKSEVSISVEATLVKIHQYQLHEESKKNTARFLKEELNKSGLFKRVRFALPSEKSDFHIHFSFFEGGTSQEDRLTAAITFGYTLGAIPVTVHNTSDVVMTIYYKGIEIYSLVAPHYNRIWMWTPLIVFLPITIPLNWPDKTRYIRYFLWQIEQNKLYNPSYFISQRQ